MILDTNCKYSGKFLNGFSLTSFVFFFFFFLNRITTVSPPGKSNSAVVNTPEGNAKLLQEYKQLLQDTLSSCTKSNITGISPEKKRQLLDYRLTNQISSQCHFALLRKFGWSLEEYEVNRIHY
jgi:hypothetical protein